MKIKTALIAYETPVLNEAKIPFITIKTQQTTTLIHNHFTASRL